MYTLAKLFFDEDSKNKLHFQNGSEAMFYYKVF